ncbi:MAG: ParB/RepB/Spo0J family partition protein, partial [Alcaligenaceae bacterium]
PGARRDDGCRRVLAQPGALRRPRRRAARDGGSAAAGRTLVPGVSVRGQHRFSTPPGLPEFLRRRVPQDGATLIQQSQEFGAGFQQGRPCAGWHGQRQGTANRHADALADAAYHELKTDIANAGKNIQPICVRPTTDGGPFDFEVVYGHRRHRACLDLGIPVQAVIADVDDKGLFEAMERENRARKNLSAWEQGMMYRRALDSGLYASQRKLAEAIGVDLSLISKSLTLARLPETVIAAFTSPLDVQFRWAQPLSEALQRDPEGLTSRAKSIAADRGVLTSKQILDSLLNPKMQVLSGSTPSSSFRIGTAGKGASLTLEANGRALLRFDSGVLTPQRQQALVAWLETQLSAGN